MLSEQVKQYLNLSSQLRPAYIPSLGSNKEVASSINEILPEVPPLLKALYDGIAGTRRDAEDQTLMDFIPGYRLIHLDEYRQEMQQLSELLIDRKQENGELVLPLLTNYASDYICYHRSKEGVEQICDLLLADHGDLEVLHASPEKFMETLCAFYEQNVYYLDDEGYLDYDLVREGEVGAVLNPDVAYWSS
ncbi:hypothetical protein SAMN03159341_101316 [Paenibacillus sp. 1_12]|uniref:hypothetical protein n=1 Tax=Paenibacillus sp. 1_12 TaxID=1566278 RepID=UPI0008F1BB82|nr:hypothetical protein [Paenibacillus sp. 1_12]SFK73258.1 hypothetical protein SAMN03159341_101316 [Paenibacillus sp. 1_12]